MDFKNIRRGIFFSEQIFLSLFHFQKNFLKKEKKALASSGYLTYNKNRPKKKKSELQCRKKPQNVISFMNR